MALQTKKFAALMVPQNEDDRVTLRKIVDTELISSELGTHF